MRSHIVNVLDTEVTCYANGNFPQGEKPEVIEVGLCEVNLRSNSIIRTLSIPVKPVTSSISPYCTQLTGWTHAKLMKQGVSFEEACRRLMESYGSMGRLLVTDNYSETDLILERCKELRIAFPFRGYEHNVSTMFALHTGELSNLSLENMLRYMGMRFEGTPHRADEDARNIARLFLKLLEKPHRMEPGRH